MSLQPQTCDANGQWQASGSPCPFVCNLSSGACTGVCIPGAKQCNGPQPQTCDANGQWATNGAACSGCSACSSGACVPSTGTSCDDGNVCTRTDTCQSGRCVGTNPTTCVALDQCHDAGTCDPTSGCSNPVKTDNTACNRDNNACTLDTCRGGVCMTGGPMTCPAAADQCHVAGTCSPSNGQCSAPTAAASTIACSTAAHATVAQCDGQGTCKAVTCASGFVNDQGVCKIPNCMGVLCGGSNGAGGICTGADGACGSGQHCNASGQCVCDATSCPSGCCDASQQCRTSGNATCGIGGARCTACPDCCTVGGQCGATWYPDGDGDHHGDANAVANGTAFCSLTQPSGSFVLDHTDCCDVDSNAFRGQTAWFQSPDVCGSYDYDCSGQEERQPGEQRGLPHICGTIAQSQCSVDTSNTTCSSVCTNTNPNGDPACAGVCTSLHGSAPGVELPVCGQTPFVDSRPCAVLPVIAGGGCQIFPGGGEASGGPQPCH